MADFVKFGTGVLDLAGALSNNFNKASVAEFLVMQQRAVQEKHIENRIEEKSRPAGSDAGAQASDPAVTGRASGAMARMKAMMAARGGK